MAIDTIILFNGTSDSGKLAVDLSGYGFDILATATTDKKVLKLREDSIKSILGKFDSILIPQYARAIRLKR